MDMCENQEYNPDGAWTTNHLLLDCPVTITGLLPGGDYITVNECDERLNYWIKGYEVEM